MFFYIHCMLNSVSETLNVQIQGNVSIEDSLRFDNITYGELPNNNEDSYYVSAEIAVFSEEELVSLQNQSIEVDRRYTLVFNN